jgi:hypothetical protein
MSRYNYSQHFNDRIFERNIKVEWVIDVIENYDDSFQSNSSEVHYIKTIVQNENRCLKVIVNPITKTIITAFFDRSLKKRGCKYEVTI